MSIGRKILQEPKLFLNKLRGYSMKIIFSFFLLFILYTVSIEQSYAQDKCKQSQSVRLSVFSKNDYYFKSFSCDAEQGKFLKNYLVGLNKNVLLNEFAANEEPKVVAVSIYNSKNKVNKNPLLISIASAYFCCTPQIEGYSYQVNIYEIKKQGSDFVLKDISKKLLKDNASGFDGQTDKKTYYKYKDIASIKKWLDKNYK